MDNDHLVVTPGRRRALGARARVSHVVDEVRARLRRGPRWTPLPPGRPLFAGETVPCRPALYDPDQLDRVTGYGFRATMQSEIEKLDARSYAEAPPEAHDLGRTVIYGQKAMAGEARYRFGGDRVRDASDAAIGEFREAHLMNTTQGLRYFGHWLGDDCATCEILPKDAPRISMRRPAWPDAAVYEALFDQRWPEIDIAHVDRLIVYRELGFSRDKAARWQKLRGRLRDRIEPLGSGRVIYIQRGQSGSPRSVANEVDLIRALSARGVEIVDPESGTDDLIRNILDADMVVTVEGSQARHAIFGLKDRGALLVLQPPDRFYNPAQEWMRTLDMPYGIVIGTGAETGFQIDPSEVLRMMDRLGAQTGLTEA